MLIVFLQKFAKLHRFSVVWLHVRTNGFKILNKPMLTILRNYVHLIGVQTFSDSLKQDGHSPSHLARCTHF